MKLETQIIYFIFAVTSFLMSFTFNCSSLLNYASETLIEKVAKFHLNEPSDEVLTKSSNFDAQIDLDSIINDNAPFTNIP